MRENNELPWWLRQDIEIIGFEEDDDDSSEEDDEDEDSDEEEEDSVDEDDDSDEEDSDEDDEGDDEDESKPNVDGLKSALRKERMGRKKAERELKKLKKQQTSSNSENEDDEDESSAADDARVERLARSLRDQAIDGLIRKHASKFSDPDDAVAFISKEDIEYDQDEDDPSVIEVDEDSVKDAVKALAKKRKYLLKPTGDGKGSKSGSKFGGSKKKSGKEITKEELQKKYAALRR